jgi:hypothetical protein
MILANILKHNMRELKFKTTLSIKVIQIQNPFHWEPQTLTQLGKIKLKHMKTINEIKTLTDKKWQSQSHNIFKRKDVKEKEEKGRKKKKGERCNFKPSAKEDWETNSGNTKRSFREAEVTSGGRLTLEEGWRLTSTEKDVPCGVSWCFLCWYKFSEFNLLWIGTMLRIFLLTIYIFIH